MPQAADILAELQAAVAKNTGAAAGLGGLADAGQEAEGAAVRFKSFIATMLGEPAAQGLVDPRTPAEVTGWMAEHGELLNKATDAAKEARQKRASQYGISVKADGHLSIPSEYAKEGAKVEDFLDPVNLKYPCHTPDRTRAAASYWGQADNRKEYSADEQRVMDGRLDDKRKKFKIGEENQKYADQAERVKVCGIPAKREAQPPQGDAAKYAHDPDGWLDFTHYELPAFTPELLVDSHEKAISEGDYTGDERLRLSFRASAIQSKMARRELEELRAKMAETGSGNDGGKRDGGQAQPPVKKEADYQTRDSIEDLALSFLDGIKAADTGDLTLTTAQAHDLVNQFAAGAKALLATAGGASGEQVAKAMLHAGDALEAVTVHAPSLADGVRMAVEETKAGKRHSNQDNQRIAAIHGMAGQIQKHCQDLGYQGDGDSGEKGAGVGDGLTLKIDGPGLYRVDDDNQISKVTTTDATGEGAGTHDGDGTELRRKLDTQTTELQAAKSLVTARTSELQTANDTVERLREDVSTRDEQIKDLEEKIRERSDEYEREKARADALDGRGSSGNGGAGATGTQPDRQKRSGEVPHGTGPLSRDPNAIDKHTIIPPA